MQALSCSQTGGLRESTGQSMNGFNKYTLIAFTMDENSADKIIFSLPAFNCLRSFSDIWFYSNTFM